jgi:type I restriction enzyme R subunit
VSTNEAETRKRLVEKALAYSGWIPIMDYARGRLYDFGAVCEHETNNGPADHILFAEGIAMAIVESKRLEVGPQNVLVQAQRYSRGFRGGPFDFGGFRVPFVYSTHGKIFWFQDLRDPRSRSRPVVGFHTASALKELLEHNLAAAQEWLKDNPLDNPFLRPYQKEAITSVEGALLSRKNAHYTAPK